LLDADLRRIDAVDRYRKKNIVDQDTGWDSGANKRRSFFTFEVLE
jgi:hypothetical protein